MDVSALGLRCESVRSSLHQALSCKICLLPTLNPLLPLLLLPSPVTCPLCRADALECSESLSAFLPSLFVPSTPALFY